MIHVEGFVAHLKSFLLNDVKQLRENLLAGLIEPVSYKQTAGAVQVIDNITNNLDKIAADYTAKLNTPSNPNVAPIDLGTVVPAPIEGEILDA